MRKLLAFMAVWTLAAFVPCTNAQSSDEAAVAQAIESLRKAMIAKDGRQFDALTSEHMSYGHSSGRVENKKQFIDAAMASKSVLKSLTFTEQSIRVVGHQAIVRHIYNGENERDGKLSTTRIGVLQIWNREQSGWRLFARQAYRL